MSQPEFPTVVDDNPELQPASPKQSSLAVVPSPPSMAVGSIGVNVEALMEKAVDAKAAVEVLERLMVMRRELQAEAAKAAFDKAMAAFQAECPVIVKSEAVHNKGGNSVRYRYAPLDVIVSQVKGLLEKHGLSHSETAQVEKDWVTAVCTVKHCQGHSEKSEFKVPIDPEAFMNAAQKFASALTFAKRYAFCNAFGILTGDADDDARSSHAEPPQTGPGRVGSPPGVSTHLPQAQTQPQQAAGKPKETTIPHATAETRQKLVERLMALQNISEEQILEYFRKLDDPSVLMPHEGLLDLPLEFVPVTQKQFEALKVAIVAFTEGGPLKHAFPPNPVAPAPAAKSRQPKDAADAQAQAESEAAEAEEVQPEDAWRVFPMPWGKQAGVPLGDLEKNYLFGLWANFEVEYEFRGKPKKPETIAKDETFRKMLDDAGLHYKFEKKPDVHPVAAAYAGLRLRRR